MCIRYLKLIIPSVLLFTSCGTEPETVPTLLLSPTKLTITVEGTGDITLKIKDFEDPIFGVSMCVAYDSTLVSFNNMDGFVVGDFFGSEIVTFAQGEPSLIHLSVVLKQGEEAVEGSGSLGVLTLQGESVGSAPIEILPSELYFYDNTGSTMTIADLEIESATATVQ